MRVRARLPPQTLRNGQRPRVASGRARSDQRRLAVPRGQRPLADGAGGPLWEAARADIARVRDEPAAIASADTTVPRRAFRGRRGQLRPPPDARGRPAPRPRARGAATSGARALGGEPLLRSTAAERQQREEAPNGHPGRCDRVGSAIHLEVAAGGGWYLPLGAPAGPAGRSGHRGKPPFVAGIPQARARAADGTSSAVPAGPPCGDD